MDIIKIIIYKTHTNKIPFLIWYEDLDNKSKAIVTSRIARIRGGNLGDCKQIKNGQGLWEFRINYGPGYRLYFGKKGLQIIILLIGGDKGSQANDIKKAKQYWLAYKESSNE
jgi:putative addiction module killer protein